MLLHTAILSGNGVKQNKLQNKSVLYVNITCNAHVLQDKLHTLVYMCFVLRKRFKDSQLHEIKKKDKNRERLKKESLYF